MKKQLFINGQWKDAQYYTPLYSPYSGDLLAEIPAAVEEEVDGAINAADEAAKTMANMPAHQRADILYRLSSLYEKHAEEAARLIALEAAKPIKQARVEVNRAIRTYRFAAEEAKRIYGETLPMDAAQGGEGRIGFTLREPLGVIGAISPFNFPVNLVAHKVGPAIAAGNSVVLKPAVQTPLSAFFLAELMQEAGLPPGALNVVTGGGDSVGRQIVADPRVKMITFTGSPAVGKEIRNKAGMKRVVLELGSNTAMIVDKDADISSIIPGCIASAFGFQGQVCISLQRLFVHEEIFNEFADAFVKAANDLKLGDPLDPETDVSTMISGKDVNRILDWIDEAIQRGAKVAAGGVAEGNILRPTVLLDAHPSSKVSCQEVFAPVVTLNQVTSVDQAVEFVNDSKYGLQASVFTQNIKTALATAKKLRVGGVMINEMPTFRVDHMPYGGVKESGMGREGVKYAMEEMTEMKLVVFGNH